MFFFSLVETPSGTLKAATSVALYGCNTLLVSCYSAVFMKTEKWKTNYTELDSFAEGKQLTSAIRINDLLWQTVFPPGRSPQTSTFRDPDSTLAVGGGGKACFQ